MIRRVTLLLTAAGALVASGLASADARAAAEQLVYWPLVTDGREYRRVAYPEAAGTLVVLAGTEAVLEARRAPVTWWPITREYLADVSGEGQEVAGTIEIVDAAGETTRVPSEPYVIWHPEGVGAGPAELVRGDAALERYDRYVRDARAAAERARAYERTRAAHQAAVEAWLRLAAERRGENMPPPPPELDALPPEPFHAYASEPREGAVLSLDEGSYTVRIRTPEGALLPDGERELTSFGPIDRAIGYVIRPGDRWTRPVISFAPDEAVYTTGETDLFFQPVPVALYRQRQLTRLFRPQSRDAVDPALVVWTLGEEPIEAGEAALRLWHGGARADTLEPVAYRVVQHGGTARGYEIERFEATNGPLTPDFTAIRVLRDAGATRLALLRRGEATPVPDSAREIRTVTPPPEALLFLPALLPLGLGLGTRLVARRRRRRAPA